MYQFACEVLVWYPYFKQTYIQLSRFFLGMIYRQANDSDSYRLDCKLAVLGQIFLPESFVDPGRYLEVSTPQSYYERFSCTWPRAGQQLVADIGLESVWIEVSLKGATYYGLWNI